MKSRATIFSICSWNLDTAPNSILEKFAEKSFSCERKYEDTSFDLHVLGTGKRAVRNPSRLLGHNRSQGGSEQ